jgi:hypothetical protein
MLNLTERLFGRTKKDSLHEMILIFEESVKDRALSEVSALPPAEQAIAEGAILRVENLMLSEMVQKTLKPPDMRRKDVRTQVPLSKLNVTLP